MIFKMMINIFLIGFCGAYGATHLKSFYSKANKQKDSIQSFLIDYSWWLSLLLLVLILVNNLFFLSIDIHPKIKEVMFIIFIIATLIITKLFSSTKPNKVLKGIYFLILGTIYIYLIHYFGANGILFKIILYTLPGSYFIEAILVFLEREINLPIVSSPLKNKGLFGKVQDLSEFIQLIGLFLLSLSSVIRVSTYYQLKALDGVFNSLYTWFLLSFSVIFFNMLYLLVKKLVRLFNKRILGIFSIILGALNIYIFNFYGRLTNLNLDYLKYIDSKEISVFVKASSILTPIMVSVFLVWGLLYLIDGFLILFGSRPLQMASTVSEGKKELSQDSKVSKLTAELHKLEKLNKDKIITDEEFEKAKKKVLDQL